MQRNVCIVFTTPGSWNACCNECLCLSQIYMCWYLNSSLVVQGGSVFSVLRLQWQSSHVWGWCLIKKPWRSVSSFYHAKTEWKELVISLKWPLCRYSASIVVSKKRVWDPLVLELTVAMRDHVCARKPTLVFSKSSSLLQLLSRLSCPTLPF